MKLRDKKQKGFTLIELVVVVVILGILVLIAAPRMMGVTATATETANKSTARAIVSALTIASTNHNGKIDDVTDEELKKAVENVTVTKSTPADGKWTYSVDTDKNELKVFFGTKQYYPVEEEATTN